MRVSDCLFCRIVAGEIPADIVLRTDDVVAFRDIDPKAPVHVLVIPTSHAATMSELVATDPGLAARWLATVVAVAEVEGVATTGFRTVVNTGADGGQTVDHVHAHLLGGRGLAWPPG